MSDTAKNRLAGGPKIYLAATASSLPALTGSTVTWANNEVQTITKTGTVSGGTATIEVVYPDGSSETTATIAYDAIASAIKSALAALDGLTSDDLTVTGGPFSTNPVVITFGGQWANTPMGLCIVDDDSITGTGTLACARTTAGRLWTELPDVVGDVKEKPIHKSTPHTPAFSPHPTGSTTTAIGIESIALEIEETDLDAFNIGLASTLLSLTPAGAGVASIQTLTQPLPADADAAVYQLCAVELGAQGGWGKISHYFAVKRTHDGEVARGTGKVNTLKINFDVFASSAQDYRCVKRYEYQSAATS